MSQSLLSKLCKLSVARRLVSALALALVASATVPAAAQQNVSGGVAHDIVGGAGGRYYVSAPAGWNGKSQIGALLFFHGYKASGAATIADASLKAAAHAGGYLLVAADGLDGTWSHTGSPAHRRDEMAYVAGLLADLKSRYPIAQDELWVAGFSQGGSMVWEVACYMGGRFKAFVAIAGAFWNPLPKSCPGGPVNLLHIHGTGDRTVPMLGRPIGSYRQGEVMKAWDIMRSSDACTVAPQRTAKIDKTVCEFWTTCRTGRQLELCLHEGGHFIPKNWAELAADFMTRAARKNHSATKRDGSGRADVSSK